MQYTRDNLEDMRSKLIEDTIDNIRSGDIFYEDIARDGFIGYDQRDDDRIIDEFEQCYGADYFEVQDEKDHKNGLYGDTI